MKANALRAKKEYLNVREMVEDIGERFSGKVAYRYRVKPHDKEAVKVTYDEMRDHVRAFATELVARGEEGINGLTISNAMHLSSWLGKEIDLASFDDDLFYAELEKRIATSTSKSKVVKVDKVDMNDSFVSDHYHTK